MLVVKQIQTGSFIIFDFIRSIHDEMIKYLYYGKFICHICIKFYICIFIFHQLRVILFFQSHKAEIIKKTSHRNLTYAIVRQLDTLRPVEHLNNI